MGKMRIAAHNNQITVTRFKVKNTKLHCKESDK